MNNESTDYPKPLEPTQPASNPYELTSPYGNVPDIPPPPPPKQGHTRLLVVLISGVCVMVLLLAAVLFVMLHSNASQGSVQATPTPRVTPTSRVTATPTPTSTPTAKPRIYDAASIVADLEAAGLVPTNVRYGAACNNGSAISPGLQSEACFFDPAICGNAACGEDAVWLEVYDTNADAYTNYEQQVQTSYGPTQQTTLLGHCVYSGNDIGFVNYKAIVVHDCQ